MGPVESIKRTFGLFKDKRRSGRPAKLRNLRDEIKDAQASTLTWSPIPAINIIGSPISFSGYDAKRTMSLAGPGMIRRSESTPGQVPVVTAETEIFETRDEPEGIAASEVNEVVDVPEPPHDESTVQMPEAQEEPAFATADTDEPSTLAEPERDDSMLIQEPVEDGESPEAPGEDLSALSFAEQQAIRDETYVAVDESGVEETDFTAGPSRMVIASDGVKPDCCALLLTLDLCAKIRDAIEFGRDLTSVEQVAARNDEANAEFEDKLDAQISRHEYQLSILEEDTSQAVSGLDDPEMDAKVQRVKEIRGQLSKLNLQVENTQAKRNEFAAQVQFKAQMFREVQAEMNKVLEAAFLEAALVAPAEEQPEQPIEVLEVDAEYQRICRLAESDAQNNNPVEIGPLPRYDEVWKTPSLSPEDKAIAELKRVLREAREQLQYARAAFDQRLYTREIEKRTHEAAVEHGIEPQDESLEVFDLRWFVRNQELTREVIDAEAAVSDAKAALVEGGGALDAQDQESNFSDHSSDGYCDEDAWVAEARRAPKVHEWLTALPEPAERVSEECTNAEIEADQWDVRSVGVNDNLSIVGEYVAQGSGRRRIDKWEKVCQLLRAGGQ